MRLILALGIVSMAMLFTVQYASAYQRTITVNMGGKTYAFDIDTYDFDQTVAIKVSDSFLKEMMENFHGNKFVFYYSLSKYDYGQGNTIEIKPQVAVGKKLEVTFEGSGILGADKEKPAMADVELSDIVTVPSVVRVDDEFKIKATVTNRGSVPISYSGICTSPISAEFMSNVDVESVAVCLALKEVLLEPGKSATVEGDLANTWKAVSAGMTSVKVTFSYWTGGLEKMEMHKVEKDYSFQIMGAEASIPVSHDGKTFDVTASLSNGNVKSINVDPDFVSILLAVETGNMDDGELVIEVPRALLDSRSNGVDDYFVVLVDGEEVEYEERNTTDNARELVIPVFAGSGEVEILGTEVVPEFPFAIIVMGAVAAMTVAAGRFRKFI
jgi:hypothetical protein